MEARETWGSHWSRGLQSCGQIAKLTAESKFGQKMRTAGHIARSGLGDSRSLSSQPLMLLAGAAVPPLLLLPAMMHKCHLPVSHLFGDTFLSSYCR